MMLGQIDCPSIQTTIEYDSDTVIPVDFFGVFYHWCYLSVLDVVLQIYFWTLQPLPSGSQFSRKVYRLNRLNIQKL